MAEFDAKKKKDSSRLKEKEQMRETFARLSAPVHVTLNSWEEHERIEGYYEFQDYGHLFSCDRLLKLETFYGKVQMGYNPNRARSFVFANMKTNIYDTVNSRYQRSMKEYQQKPEQKKGNENRAWVSGRWQNASVLLEKAENKPWSVRSMEPYLHNTNMETILKTMPYLSSEQELSQLSLRKEAIVQMQKKVSENARKNERSEDAQLHERMREASEESALLQAILARKDSQKRAFIRKLNYAFDIDKKRMFEYYREQRRHAMQEEISVIDAEGDGMPQEASDDERKK